MDKFEYSLNSSMRIGLYDPSNEMNWWKNTAKEKKKTKTNQEQQLLAHWPKYLHTNGFRFENYEKERERKKWEIKK